MQVPEDYVEEPYDRSKSTKRTDSDALSPPNIDASKKLKMAARITPELVAKLENLASKEDIKTLFDKGLEEFKAKCFVPFKTEIMEKVSAMESKVDAFPGQLKSLENDLKQSLEFNSHEIGQMDKKMRDLEMDNKTLHSRVNELQDLGIKQNRELKSKMVDMEDRQRRDNLVIDGIPDTANESSKNCEKNTRTFLKNTMHVNNSDRLMIGRVHRLGPYKENQTRSTIIKFDNFKHREAVWEGRKKLPNGSNIRVKENFSKETEASRAQLSPIMRMARKKDYYARLDAGKLIIRNRDKSVNLSVTVDTLDTLPPDLQPEKLFTPSRLMVTLFYSKHSPHSNFKRCKFTENGKDYNCVEQYFVQKNALAAGNTGLAERVMKEENPAVIKSMGKEIVNLDPDTKLENMKKGMTLKYSQNEDLLQKLKDTEGTELAEANPHDDYWGIGLGIHDAKAFEKVNWNGQNMTGKILMEVRQELCPANWDSEGEETAMEEK